MPDQEDAPSRIEGKQLQGPLRVTTPKTTPSVGLFQPTYPLTEVDFVNLQRSSPLLAAVGGAVTSFGLSTLLPLGAKLFEQAASERDFLTLELKVSYVTVVVGLAFLGLSFFVSSPRRSVLAKIRSHFRDNPGEMVHTKGKR